MRRVILRPTLVFLDKLCIPQDDEELKAPCALGLRVQGRGRRVFRVHVIVRAGLKPRALIV